MPKATLPGRRFLPPRMRDDLTKFLLLALDALSPAPAPTLVTLAWMVFGTPRATLFHRLKRLADAGIVQPEHNSAHGVGRLLSARGLWGPGLWFTAAYLEAFGVPPRVGQKREAAFLEFYLCSLWLLAEMADGARILSGDAWTQAAIALPRADKHRGRRDDIHERERKGLLPALPPGASVLGVVHVPRRQLGLAIEGGSLGPGNLTFPQALQFSTIVSPVRFFFGPTSRSREVALTRAMASAHSLYGVGELVTTGTRSTDRIALEQELMRRFGAGRPRPEFVLAALLEILEYRARRHASA